MGKNKRTRRVVMQRFAQMKRMISLTDSRIKPELRAPPKKVKKENPTEIKLTEA